VVGSKVVRPLQDFVLARPVSDRNRYVTASGLEVVEFADRDTQAKMNAIKDVREAEVIAVGPGVYLNTGSEKAPGKTFLNRPQCEVGDRILVWWKDVFVFKIDPIDTNWFVAASSILGVIEDA